MNLNENISRVKGLMGIISENRNPWLMRRIGEIHEFVKLALRRVPAGGYSYHDYVEEIAWQVADEYGHENVSNIDDLLEFVRDNYWKEIQDEYLKSTDDSLNEYFDPIYFLKKKMSKEPRQIKPEQNIKYEEGFQKYVNFIFKFTYRSNPLEHLKGFEVIKVTPNQNWTVLLRPKIDDWFNYCDNSDYKEKLENFEEEFKSISKMTSMGSPFSEEGLPENVTYTFWNNC